MKTNMLNSGFVQPEDAFRIIQSDWKQWAKGSGIKKYVVGISGGVDSSCVAALAVKIFGKDNVVGVTLPCDSQKDINDSYDLIKHLGIKHVEIDIGDANVMVKNAIENNGIELTEQCTTNLPCRLRMVTLFAVAQCLNAGVLNTCNRSEDILGYNTIFGDNCGCYAPLKNMLKTEVMALAAWLGVPEKLAYKTPADGLQPLSDEERFGFTYKKLDRMVRCIDAVAAHNVSPFYKKVHKIFSKNKFKLDIVDLPGPEFRTYLDLFRANEEM